MSVNILIPNCIAKNIGIRIFSIRLILLAIFTIESIVSVFAYKQTYNVNIGETFTVYTTSRYYTQSVLWTYDARIVEPVGYVGSATTSIKFKAKQAVSSYVIQAITYYYESSTSSTLLKSVDDWLVKITDNSKVTLDKNSYTLSRGESFYLNATASNSEYSGKYTWSSSNSDVAYIVGNTTSKSAKISTLYSGNATITVKLDNGNSATCSVRVNEIDVKSASISPTNTTLNVGETASLSLSVTPNNAKISSKSWKSKNTNIASVDSYGTVTAVSSGTTEIYCVVNGNVTSSSCEVTVKKPIAPTDITVSPTVMYINKGDTRKLSYSLTPYNATTTVTWSSDNTSIATVNSNGEVKGINKGVTTIYATTENGKTASCEVTVNTIEATSISLPVSQTLKVGETVTLTYNMSPSNATNSVTWKSADTSIATVSSSGVVTGKKEGSTNITVTTDNGKSASCKVCVESKPIDPTKITLPTSCNVEVGYSTKMRYTLEPGNATTTITWKSSDTSIATVSSDGIVKGIKQGSAKITATTDNGLSADIWVYIGGFKEGTIFYGTTSEDYDVTYKVTDINANTCAVIRCEKTAKRIVIPSSVQGYKVTSIKQASFSQCEIEEISLPNSLTTIGTQAFSWCKSLKSISIPNSVTSIEEESFQYCEKLESVVLSNNMKRIEHWLFWECTSLLNVSGYNNIEYIDIGAFNKTPWLANLPDGENYIGKVLLTYKGKMPANTTIKIKDGCTQIAGSAFSNQVGLVAITIPSSLVILDSNPFYGCDNLRNITVSTANTVFDSRDNCNAIIKTKENELVVVCAGTTIPNTVEVIGSFAFADKHNIVSITIPNSVTTINDYAFSYMDNLRSITIGKNVKNFGKNILNYYTNVNKNLTSIRSMIDFPTGIDKDVFRKCYGQEDSIYNHVTLYIPRGSKANYQSAAGWKNFKHIVEIGDEEIFKGMVFTEKTVEGVELTYAVTDATQKECELVASPVDVKGKVTIPASANGLTVRSIGEKVFYSYKNDRALTEVVIPNTIKTFGPYAFYFCEDMIATIPSSVTSIGDFAFYNCKKITAEDLSNVTTFGRNALNSCGQIESIKLGSSVKIIGEWAFFGTGITNITIPKTVESIGKDVLGRCEKLQSIKVEDGNPHYDSRNNCNAIFVNATNTLLAGCMNTIIPEETDTIGYYAFYYHSQLKEIKLPDNLKTIADWAFMGTGLSSITIPESVDSIGTSAFRNCANLTTVKVLRKEPLKIKESVFFKDTDTVYTFDQATLYVPMGTKVKYQEADGWKNFKNIVEFDPTGIDDITVDEDVQQTIYSISGVRLKNPQKGLNIINGKKVMVK